MKIEKWCEMNQITKRQYYYWHKKVMHERKTRGGSSLPLGSLFCPFGPPEAKPPESGGVKRPPQDIYSNDTWNSLKITQPSPLS